MTREEHQAAIKRKKHTGWLWITAGIILAIGFVGFFIYKNSPTILSGITHSDQAKIASSKSTSSVSSAPQKKTSSAPTKKHLAFPKSTVKGRLGMRLVTFREILPFTYRRLIRIPKLTPMTNRNGRQATLSYLS